MSVRPFVPSTGWVVVAHPFSLCGPTDALDRSVALVFHHVEIRILVGLAARDPQCLKSWYTNVLGASLVFQNGQTPLSCLLSLPGGGWIEIYPASHSVAETGYNRVAGWRHFALRVDSIEGARVVLRSRGVEFSEPIKPAGGGGRVLFFRDPEGNLLHLVERESGGAVT